MNERVPHHRVSAIFKITHTRDERDLRLATDAIFL